MIFPKLRNIPTSKDMLDIFKGYNHNLRIGEGEFYEMTNLSSDDYPLLTPRSKRAVYYTPGNYEDKPQGILSKERLCFVYGSKVALDNTSLNLRLSIDEKPKILASMGKYLIIFPDLMYLDVGSFDEVTTEIVDYGSVNPDIGFKGSEWNSYDETYYDTILIPCRADGTVYENIIESRDQPSEDSKDGTLWINESRWRVYDRPVRKWRETNGYVIIFNAMFRHDLKVGELVDLDVPYEYSYNLSGTRKTIIGVLEHEIIVEGKIWNLRDGHVELFPGEYKNEKIEIRRAIPDMDFVISSGNRLWGCNSWRNEIYASKLGDFRRWYCFEGISTDSFIASVGSDGPFTGAIEYKGNPIFFKENCMHIVYGDYPSNYQVKTLNCRGVQKGCEDSLAILNEKLYYKSTDGICVYDGSLPVNISAELGSVSYKNAAAGVLKDKYYISMCDSSDMWHMFVYDSSKGLWHREDDTHATCFCTHDGDLYYIDYADNSIKTVKGSVGALESTPVKWEAVSGILGTSSPDKKYISRLDVRMMLDIGSTVTLYAEYDSCGAWEHLFTMAGRPELRSFTVPVRPRRCDHLRLKIVGVGESKIFSICKTYETGSGD